MTGLRIGFVTGQYGPAARGEAESHCRLFAERLAIEHRVEVLTTRVAGSRAAGGECPEAFSEINRVRVRRFEIDEAGPSGRRYELARRIFRGGHTQEDELRWLECEEPLSTALLEYTAARANAYDAFIFYCYRHPLTFFGLPLVAGRAILVPAARPEPALYLGIFDELFRHARSVLCLTPEEAAFLERRFFDCDHLEPGVIGTGLDLTPPVSPDSTWTALLASIGAHPFLLCPGEPDDPDGVLCAIDLFRRYLRETARTDVKLLLLGHGTVRVPDHPQLLAVSAVPETTLHAAFRDARFVLAPSARSILGRTALEAWSFGKPVLANGACAVLRGQCARSNAGLWYTSYDEFREAMNLLLGDHTMVRTLGAQGRAFVARTCSWDEFDRRAARALATVTTGAPGPSGGIPLAEPVDDRNEA
jgi:glycosyltransferase involved in cell wall biosynthesis